MEWYMAVWQKYAQFSGRARRKEYWMFVLVNAIIYVVLYTAGMVMLLENAKAGALVMFVLLIYALAALLPGLAVGVRRLHDTGKSGWWLLISLVPLVGGIVLLIFLATDGEPGSNLYGPNPRLMTMPVAS